MEISQRIETWFAGLPGPVRAGFWISCTGATFTGMMAISRHLSADLHIFVIIMFRSLFGLTFLSALVFRGGTRILHTKRFKLYSIRGVTAYLSLVGYFYAATHIPLADISAIIFTRPVFACIAAILFLGELARGRRWAAIAIGFIGGLIVVRPGFAEFNIGVLFAVGAVAMTVFNTIFIKSLSFTDHPDTIAIYQGLCVAPIAFIVAMFFWSTPSWEQFAWLIAMGALGAATQRTLARSYVAADATVVTVLDFLRLPIAALIGLFFFGEWPVVWVWVGGAVIVASSFLLTQREVNDKDVNKTPPGH
ncbi:MAG: DMT family transporter [Rhodospirillaceae bacterium]|jgi:drug/metabolite transporter (DMT)-like permease|nr:DMT family transporter [Rhodospirillaceae bacterium]